MSSTAFLPFWGTLRGVKPRTQRTKTRIGTFHVELSRGYSLPPVAVGMRGFQLRLHVMTLKANPTSVTTRQEPITDQRPQPQGCDQDEIY